MAITRDDIVAIAPEFAGLSQNVFTVAIADSALLINAPKWGTRADMAQKYLAAHMIGMSHPDEASPVVSQESAGGVSRMYAVGFDADPRSYSLTRHGRFYLDLLRSFRTTPIVP